MPGRAGYSVTGGWATSSGSGTSSSPANLSISSRAGNAPAEYVASESVEFTLDFESGSGDAFDAYLGNSVGAGGSGSSNGSASGGYRYGFNGKEQDGETYGEGNIYDYGFRIYNPRIGSFMSVDPLASSFPYYTPYQFSGNKPIWAKDLDGLEEVIPKVDLKAPVLRAVSESTCQGCAATQQAIAFRNVKPKAPAVRAPAIVSQQDNSPWAQRRRQELQDQAAKEKAIKGATMDQFAAQVKLPAMNTAKEVLQSPLKHGYGIYEGIKEGDKSQIFWNSVGLALDISPFVKIPGLSSIEVSSISISSAAGGATAEMAMVRTIAKGEKLADIINEAKALTWQTGNEHALVKLANGERALVSGGPGGITFKENQIQTLFGHTHPTSAPPSSADASALNQLGQTKQYVLHGGETTVVRPKQ